MASHHLGCHLEGGDERHMRKDKVKKLIVFMLAVPAIFCGIYCCACTGIDDQGLFGENKAHREIDNANPTTTISCIDVLQDPLENFSQANEDVQQNYQDIVDCVCHMGDIILDGKGDHSYNFAEIEYACKLNFVNEKGFQSLTKTILTDSAASSDVVMIGRLNTCQSLVMDCQ